MLVLGSSSESAEPERSGRTLISICRFVEHRLRIPVTVMVRPRVEPPMTSGPAADRRDARNQDISDINIVSSLNTYRNTAVIAENRGVIDGKKLFPLRNSSSKSQGKLWGWEI